MGHADDLVDKTLDVRRIFKVERLLSSLACIVLDNKTLVSLAKKQRHGIVLSVQKMKIDSDINQLLDLSEKEDNDSDVQSEDDTYQA